MRNTRPSNTSSILEDPILYHSQLEQHIDLQNIHLLNQNLILQLITPNSLHIPLLKITSSLSSYTNLEFYTDGSLNRDNDIPIMGYNWIFSSNFTDNIKHSGSCKEWPSSLKAELVAILTSLIVCPPDSNVHIYTDSASCIATFNMLYPPKLTARHFQKLNNCALWNTLKHIINVLKLKISLFKVKANSGHPLNDAADLLAKEGLLSKDFLQINIRHITTQACHLTFNDSIIIDRNIRKSVKRIINFQYFEQHLSHQNLHKIKDYSLENIIDWEFSQLWFKYNPFTKPTSKKYFKHNYMTTFGNTEHYNGNN
uniref:RNase H type-1 domain-containing protein n=1 Tax=Rhizophagus irregularis (strain DAOM 181602 / DAOM 197198 / MUCL 43194) TaxID=747089 RepID=U9T121_RHIID